jgi:hypothetical protein
MPKPPAKSLRKPILDAVLGAKRIGEMTPAELKAAMAVARAALNRKERKRPRAKPRR